MSVRELIAELAILQDQITQTAARAGYSAAPPLHPLEPTPGPVFDRPQGDRRDPPGADGADGIVEALYLHEALERRERTVLAELHRRPTP